MYSMVLFMVDTSLSGFFGSGDRPTSGGRQDLRDQLVWRPAGELHVAGQAQFVTHRHQIAEAVTRADQRERDVITAELMDHDADGAHNNVDAVLRPHDTDVGGQEPAAAAQLRARLATPQPLRVRAAADHRYLAGRLAVPCYGDVPVGLVGRNHMVRGPVCPALHGPQQLVRQPRAVGETGLVELRAEVVMIEHEPGAVENAKGQRDRPEDVRRVACLDHTQPAGSPRPERQPCRGEEGVSVLRDEAELAANGLARPVLVQLNGVN